MRLTRRDAIAALAAAGVAAGGGAIVLSSDDGSGGSSDPSIDDADVATMIAAAEVLYPSAIEDVGEFVGQYVRGRADDRPEHGRGTADAASYLREYSKAWYEQEFAALDPSTREEALERMNADTADADPDGSPVERVRYYVVDELLFALYATPTGGELVGLENPQGYPGGLASYQRGPES